MNIENDFKVEVGRYIRYMPTIGSSVIISKVLEKHNRGLAYLYKLDTEKELVPIEHFDDIYKSSPNIIDLIEVGDYVNGHRVLNKYDNDFVEVGVNLFTTSIYGNSYINELRNYASKDIKEILTHEQYQNNIYKVERE